MGDTHDVVGVPHRRAGFALMAGATLLAARAVLAGMAGPPPGSGVEILQWAETEHLWLALANEVSMIGAAVTLAGFSALRTGFWTGWAAGLLAAAVPFALAMDIVYGRLVYPVYGLSLADPVSAELVVMVAWGGQHAVWLLRAAAAFLLTSGPGRVAAVVGGVGAVLAAYPWLLPAEVVLLAELAWVGWLGSAGWRLTRQGVLHPDLPTRG
jgi:hypothetical protein